MCQLVLELLHSTQQQLNPEDGLDYVAEYIDDVLVFSHTPEEHLEHLCRVIERDQDMGLKLKSAKYQLIQDKVEYLGHLIIP